MNMVKSSHLAAWVGLLLSESGNLHPQFYMIVSKCPDEQSEREVK